MTPKIRYRINTPEGVAVVIDAAAAREYVERKSAQIKTTIPEETYQKLDKWFASQPGGKPIFEIVAGKNVIHLFPIVRT